MINDLVKRDKIMNYGGKWKIRPTSTRQDGRLGICELKKFVIVLADGLLK